METVRVNGRLVGEEMEVYFNLDPISKVWTLEAYRPKWYRKALKQGWTPIREYVYDDGTVCGMVFTGPERAVTIRNAKKKTLSEKQFENLSQGKDDESNFAE